MCLLALCANIGLYCGVFVFCGWFCLFDESVAVRWRMGVDDKM